MIPAEPYSYLSSRLVREIARLGGPVTGLVPPDGRGTAARQSTS